MEALLNSFLLVAASEMGDKTQLLAFSLASRYRRPWVVMGGILTATLLSNTLASSVGDWAAAHVPQRLLSGILALTFFGFGIWTLRPDRLEKEDKGPERFGPFATTVVLFFVAELADKTQLATVALAARYHAVMTVIAGTTLGMLAADGLAVFAGERLAERAPMKWIRALAAALFFVFGAVSAYGAIRG